MQIHSCLRLLIGLAVCSAELGLGRHTLRAEQRTPELIQEVQQGVWRCAIGPNVTVRTTARQVDPKAICLLCEDYRTRTIQRWLAPEVGASQSWTPRCEVVVHSTQAEYQRALGPAAGSSVGCSTVQVKHGKVLVRKIDVRIDAAGWQVDALPHEMTHIVLTDYFGERKLPLWADEGMSVLAESSAKCRLRKQAAEAEELRLPAISAASLLLEPAEQQARRQAFYYRSAELVNFLIQQKDYPAFIRFLDQVEQQGYERALHAEYGIRGVAQLQTIWHKRQPQTFFVTHVE